MRSRFSGKPLTATPLLALPLLFVPALCFALNRASFLWSVLVIGVTTWRWHQTKRNTIRFETPAKDAFSQLVFATCVIQMLAFAWIGAVWALEAVGRLIMLSSVASRVVAWIQAQWFAELAAWLVLFAVVCGLLRLGRPLLAWHQRSIINAVLALKS